MLPDLLHPLISMLPAAVGGPLAGPFGALLAAPLLALLLALPRATRPAAVGAGLLAGVLWLLPAIWPSPRQVPERLPVLAAGLLVLPLLLTLPRLPPAAVRGVALLVAAWWMAGAPLRLADVSAAAVPLGAMAAAGLWCALRPPGPLPVAGIGLALTAALLVGGWAGGMPAALAAAAALVALVGVMRRAVGPAADAALCGLLIALAAMPAMTRGLTLDWLVVAAGLLALLFGRAGAIAIRGVFTPPAAGLLGPVAAALPALGVAAWLSGLLS